MRTAAQSSLSAFWNERRSRWREAAIGGGGARARATGTDRLLIMQPAAGWVIVMVVVSCSLSCIYLNQAAGSGGMTAAQSIVRPCRAAVVQMMSRPAGQPATLSVLSTLEPIAVSRWVGLMAWACRGMLDWMHGFLSPLPFHPSHPLQHPGRMGYNSKRSFTVSSIRHGSGRGT